MIDYSANKAYKSVDYQNIGFIDIKGLDNFFKRLFVKNIQLEDTSAIIRRLDLDSDCRLSPEEFMKGIKAQEPFSKMLIRNQQKRDENYGKKYEKMAVKERAKPGQKQEKELKAYKAHYADMGTRFNQDQRLDRDHEDVSGVSPIRHRHDVDLYGVKNGLGKFNPIMVENVNRIPDIYDYDAPEAI